MLLKNYAQHVLRIKTKLWKMGKIGKSNNSKISLSQIIAKYIERPWVVSDALAGGRIDRYLLDPCKQYMPWRKSYGYGIIDDNLILMYFICPNNKYCRNCKRSYTVFELNPTNPKFFNMFNKHIKYIESRIKRKVNRKCICKIKLVGDKNTTDI